MELRAAILQHVCQSYTLVGLRAVSWRKMPHLPVNKLVAAVYKYHRIVVY